MKNFKTTILLLLSLFIIPIAHAQLVTTDFTYQGELMDNGVPANGNYDILINAYTVESGGTAFPFPSEFTNVNVINGLFSLKDVEFGDLLFIANTDIWLGVFIKKPADLAYTELAPRQKINASPYSIKSEQANFATNLDVAGSNNDVLVHNGTTWATGGNKIRVSTVGVSVGTSSIPPLNGLRVGGDTNFDGDTNQAFSSDGLPKYLVNANCELNGHSISGKDLTGNNGVFSIEPTNTPGYCFITFPQSVASKYWVVNSLDNDGGNTSCNLTGNPAILACQRVDRLGAYVAGNFSIVIF